MRWTTLFPAVLAAAALLPAAAAPAQDGAGREGAPSGAADDGPGNPEARAERLRRARERWESLSPGERDRLLRAYEEWRSLSEDKREALRQRFEAVGGRKGADLVRKRLEEERRRSPERLARMRMQSESLGRIVDRVVGTAPERAREALAALPPDARERVRRRVGRAVLEVARRTMIETHATAEEREALRSGTAERKREVLDAIRKRAGDEALSPHREELEALPEERRRVRRAALLEEGLWKELRGRGEEVGSLLGRLLQEGAKEGGRGGGRGGTRERSQERFRERFGVSPEELGDPRAARSLVHAAVTVPEERREAFLEKVRAELLRIRALPEPDRAPALHALLETL